MGNFGEVGSQLWALDLPRIDRLRERWRLEGRSQSERKRVTLVASPEWPPNQQKPETGFEKVYCGPFVPGDVDFNAHFPLNRRIIWWSRIVLSGNALGSVHKQRGARLCLYRPCATTTWKCLIPSFMEDVNKRQRISFSLSKLECGPQEINSREIRLHLPFSANWNKRDKDCKNGNSF